MIVTYQLYFMILTDSSEEMPQREDKLGLQRRFRCRPSGTSCGMVACGHVPIAEGFVCHSCGSGSFIVKDAQWATMESPALHVDSRCAICGAGNTVSLPGVRRCGFEAPYGA